MKTKRGKKIPSRVKAPSGIWCAFSYDNCLVGYLVTEAGNLNRPIAFVDTTYGRAPEGFSIAREIRNFYLREPWRAMIADDISVIDLSPYAYPDSRAPMPGFVFGLRCVPADAHGERQNIPDKEPRPPCRFMADALKQRRPSRARRR